MLSLSIIQQISIYVVPLIFAITLHEAAHAYMAKKHGDNTAEQMGRLSLNPIKHIDLIGTIIFPLIGIIFSNFIFGWARPVPLNFARLHNPKRDLLWVALAGPLANLAMALIWILIFKGSIFLDSYFGVPLELMAQAGISVNISLMLLNLLPILPLDGGRILFSLLPSKLAYQYAKTESYGMIILILLLLSGGLTYILQPMFSFFMSLI